MERSFINTTVGRAILNDHLPEGMPYINGCSRKKALAQLVNYCYLTFGLETTVRMLDEVKTLGFQFATRSGLSIGIDDMVIPDSKKTLVKDAEKQVVAVQQQYLDGAITNGERYNKVIEIWSAITEKVADEMFGDMQKRDKEGEINPIYVMADSGARGSKQQIRQLSGMRGLMAKPSGEIIESPITANFREGSHGAGILRLDPRRPQGIWPTRRSRRRIPATSLGGWSTWRRTSSSANTTAARSTASTCRASSKPAKLSSRCATALWAAYRSRRSKTTTAT